MKRLALDPGVTSGICLHMSGDEPWSTHLDVPGTEDLLAHYIMQPGLVDEVIVEKFTISERTLKTKREGAVSIELMGVARFLCRKAGKRLVEQMPAEAMGFATDAKLRKVEWYTPNDHERDARRHMLTRVCEMGDFNLLLFLADGGE